MRKLPDGGINPFSVHRLYFDARFRVLSTSFVPLTDPQLNESECWTLYPETNHIECFLDPDSEYRIPTHSSFVSLDIVKRRGFVYLCRVGDQAGGAHRVVLWELG